VLRAEFATKFELNVEVIYASGTRGSTRGIPPTKIGPRWTYATSSKI
jgi:hypothetical protein